MYDYGARHYDPYMGGWINVDPMAEKYYSISPYVYCVNNPVNFIDPNGMWIQHSDSTGSYRYSNGQWEKYQTEGENAGKYTVFTPEAGSFLSGVLDGLNRLNKNVTGNDLLIFFANDENNTFIVPGEANTIDVTGSARGEMTLSKIFKGSEIPTEYGIQMSPFWLDIGHELAHRKDILTNGAEQAGKEWLRNPDTGGIISQSEKYATHMENMMRADAGLPLRTHYARQGSGGWAPSMILNKGTRTSKFYGTTYRTTPRILIPKGLLPKSR